MVETVRCAGVSSDDMPSEPCSSYVEERSVDADRATDTTVGLPSLKHRFQDGGFPLGEDDGRLQYVVHHGAFDKNPLFRDIYVGDDPRAEAGPDTHIMNCRIERLGIKGAGKKQGSRRGLSRLLP